MTNDGNGTTVESALDCIGYSYRTVLSSHIKLLHNIPLY